MDKANIAPPCLLVILGAAGDLTRRKLMPALYAMHRAGHLPASFAILGTARAEMDDAAFRAAMRAACDTFGEAVTDTEWTSFAARLHYQTGNFNDVSAYQSLAARISGLDARHATDGNRMFFLATLPSLYAGIAAQLGAAGLVHSDPDGPFSRVLIEKPFGHDLASAQALNRALHDVFREEQIFRIDHYLAKETVQNILVLRFANALFEPLWNRQHIDHVQISATEHIGVGSRGGYYEESGVLRDMVQNHLLQLLALVAMEAPLSFAADRVRDRKVDVFRALRPLIGEDAYRDVVLGQYAASADGAMPGYHQEAGVASDSITPSYAALKVQVDNWRWQGVPFYLRTGKRLAQGCAEVVVQFRTIPFCAFGEEQACTRIAPNRLVLCIQPDESVRLEFAAKVPGPGMAVETARMHFGFHGRHPDAPPAYQRLLLDALHGEQLLFARADGVEMSWRFITPILEAYADHPGAEPYAYPAGSRGPVAADTLIARDGHAWQPLGGV
ncbi:glucose-6-phosphate 1-dehydrogenase [Sulfuriferula plumbiphila]|uniref:Glucose-6-phosphate 1-dehydrogenase n=1 Tax=Sulfuriferula plumbiphila TaxID=171865 RepID=A0A512LCW6_9PROT|nr:glucose-6-phosphate dehydrogenase [Sulfuriferula plumbiphila]BBP05413.1 glucose-6-phosphate 1-dehydrogenase [Sulfuriferula plumbiphila]GEP31981.1 glucose-6-phosphate 1-dehydrogenase [Sulfuriferula plumbiphila]